MMIYIYIYNILLSTYIYTHTYAHTYTRTHTYHISHCKHDICCYLRPFYRTSKLVKCCSCLTLLLVAFKVFHTDFTLIGRFMGPTWAHLGPTGLRWAPCCPHKLCYLGSYDRCSTWKIVWCDMTSVLPTVMHCFKLTIPSQRLYLLTLVGTRNTNTQFHDLDMLDII